ncbi:MAG: proline--tRNA ligase [Thermoplasmatota archaeon]
MSSKKSENLSKRGSNPYESMDSEDFSEWYNEAIELAELTDKRYPVKGMNIWRPYGWEMMSIIDRKIRKHMRNTNHNEVNFPLLIPEDEFQKEADHIKGFGEEVFWVTKTGRNPLDIPLLLRPTSETAMYPVFDLWIRSHADLPLKIFQIVNVFRYETKQTRAFMRMREIHFFESHTCHATFEGAEDQISEDLDIMKKLAEKLCLPYLELKRTEWDKFPGAEYTVGVDTLLPTGRLLQIAGIHQYRTNFSKAYDISFEDINGEHKNVHQTTYGMSERLIGSIVSIHGDDKGVVIPPSVAPIQVRIIPITYGDEQKIIDYCKKIKNKLEKEEIRVDVDYREDVRPGSKFYDSELKGIPVRFDIGRNEFEDKEITMVRRDTGEKSTIKFEELIMEIESIFETIQKDMYRKANEFLQENIVDASDYSEINQEKVYRIGWCGSYACGEDIEINTDRDILGTLYKREDYSGKCICCGKGTDTAAYLCKTH